MPIDPELIAKMDACALPERGAKVVVGVSGGSDSTFLALALRQLAAERDYHVRLAHYRHDAEASDQEALRMVQALSERLALPLEVSEPREHAVEARDSDSEQMGLRRMRFAFFGRVVERVGANALCLAHSLDDQAETVLMRALKGRWLEGLAGIPPQRALDGSDAILFHPCLGLTRQEMQNALKAEGVAWHEDPANQNPDYERVAMRRGLLAKARDDFGEGALDALGALATQAREMDEAMVWSLQYLKHDVKLEESAGVYKLDMASELPPFFWRTLLRQILMEMGLSSRDATFARVERLRNAQETRGAQELGEGVLYRRVADQLRIWREETAS